MIRAVGEGAAADDILCILAEISGDDVAETFRLSCGGTRVYIPAQVTSDCQLARRLGVDMALRVAAALGPGWAIVPKRGRKYWQRILDRAVELRRGGMPVPDVALACGISETTVYAAVKRTTECHHS